MLCSYYYFGDKKKKEMRKKAEGEKREKNWTSFLGMYMVPYHGSYFLIKFIIYSPFACSRFGCTLAHKLCLILFLAYCYYYSLKIRPSSRVTNNWLVSF